MIQLKLLNLSQDFRNDNSHKKSKRNFIYGLPEINQDEIKKAQMLQILDVLLLQFF